MKIPEAYNRLGNIINQYGQTEAIERIIEGLRRLTSEYQGKELEEIILRIIKGDIFAYVYSSDYYPPYNKVSEISWGLGLIIMNVAPALDKPPLDNIPHHMNGIYVLIQDNTKAFKELYFISSSNRSSITKIKIEQNNLDNLANKIFSAEIDKNYTTGITELTVEQTLQIKKMTGHILRINETRGTWRETAGWQALLPSQVNIIISNKNHKVILKPGQQGFDINDLWVEKQKIDDDSKNNSTQPPTSDDISNKKRNRSEQHPLFLSYSTNYSRTGSFGSYKRMMLEEKYVFTTKGDYFAKANDDNTDNTNEHIKHVAFVHGMTKSRNPKYDIYYKPVLKNGASLGKAKHISARTAESYFNPKKRKSNANNT